MHKYDKKLNGKEGYCEVCFKYKVLVQHHVDGRRYSDDCIWVCSDCHKEIHANPEYSYEHHFMRKHNGEPVTKKTKDKRCGHTKGYWKDGKLICQLCGRVVNS